MAKVNKTEGPHSKKKKEDKMQEKEKDLSVGVTDLKGKRTKKRGRESSSRKKKTQKNTVRRNGEWRGNR